MRARSNAAACLPQHASPPAPAPTSLTHAIYRRTTISDQAMDDQPEADGLLLETLHNNGFMAALFRSHTEITPPSSAMHCRRSLGACTNA